MCRQILAKFDVAFNAILPDITVLIFSLVTGVQMTKACFRSLSLRLCTYLRRSKKIGGIQPAGGANAAGPSAGSPWRPRVHYDNEAAAREDDECDVTGGGSNRVEIRSMPVRSSALMTSSFTTSSPASRLPLHAKRVQRSRVDGAASSYGVGVAVPRCTWAALTGCITFLLLSVPSQMLQTLVMTWSIADMSYLIQIELQLLQHIFLAAWYTRFAVSFPIQLLVNPTFRQQLRLLLKGFLRRCGVIFCGIIRCCGCCSHKGTAPH